MEPNGVSKPIDVWMVHSTNRTDGVEASAADFVAARWRALAKFGFLLTGDVASGEDLVQEALVKCLPRWRRLDPAGTESYIRTVMARAAWKRARRPRMIPLGNDLMVQESGTEHSGRAADVALALARLPRDQRVVVVLRYWLDYDEATIARMLNCRPGTVKSRTSRAYAQLRSDLSLSGYAESADNTSSGEEQ
jgi:RNA polymerase sigma-70 factor (sigma-E family)